MAEVVIGDRVLAVDASGSLTFSDVYMFGHRDPTTVAVFVKITTSSGAIMRLTPDHYLYATIATNSSALATSSKLSPAKAITTEHYVWVGAPGDSLQLEKVVEVSLHMDAGLYNPYTLSGAVVVDGVLTSCHSSSVLDDVFELLGVSIPAGYQVN
jgi:hypothetical protein